MVVVSGYSSIRLPLFKHPLFRKQCPHNSLLSKCVATYVSLAASSSQWGGSRKSLYHRHLLTDTVLLAIIDILYHQGDNSPSQQTLASQWLDKSYVIIEMWWLWFHWLANRCKTDQSYIPTCMPMGEARGGMCDCLRVDGSGGGVRAHV